MLSFRGFLSEKMNERDHVVPVTQFFAQNPLIQLQADIPTILDALKGHQLHPIFKPVELRRVIPTQNKVSLPKVMKKLTAGDNPNHALVVLQSGSGYYLLDGHHRFAALVLQGVAAIGMTVLAVADVARILST